MDDYDIPITQALPADDFPIVVWAWRRLPELGERTGQIRVPESIARPLIDAGLLQEWAATDGQDLKWVDVDLPPPGGAPAQMTVTVNMGQPGVFNVTFGGPTDTADAVAKFIVQDNGEEILADVTYPQPAGTTRQEAAGLLQIALQSITTIDATKNGAILALRGVDPTVLGYVAGSLTLAAAPPPPPPTPAPAPPVRMPQATPPPPPSESPTLMTTQSVKTPPAPSQP